MTMSENREQRGPRNLQGLLRLAAENTSADDSSSRANHDDRSQAFMSDERRQWLSEMLAGMSSDHISVMNENIKIILDGIERRKTIDDMQDDENISCQELALDNVTDMVDNLDNANDFHKIGGFNLILPLLRTTGYGYAGLRWRTAYLLAVLVQNNPYCQNAALNESNGAIINLLLTLMDSDGDATVKIKCVHALSCLARGNSDAQKVFQDLDGFSFLLKAIESDIEKLIIKSCFLLKYYCDDNPGVKETLCNMGYIELLVNLLHREHSYVHEHLLSALLSFVTDHEPSLTECLRSELKLKRILTNKIEEFKDKEEFLEEVEYSQKLLDMCFPKMDDDNDNPKMDNDTTER